MTAWDALAARRAGVPVFAPGHVWLAGAGPGDPGLLTLDALAGLAQADVVVHDALVDRARAGARRRAGAARICRQARRQAIGDPGRHQPAPGRAGARRPARAAAQGRRSIRVRPRRRGGHGARGRRRSVPRDSRRHRRTRGAGGGGIPATLRGTNRAVIFAAGHGADEDFDWAPLARAGQPIVLYMVMHNLERITAALMAGGLAARHAGRRDRLGDDAEAACPGLDAGKTRRRRARAKNRAAGDRRDRRHRRRCARETCSAKRRSGAERTLRPDDRARAHHRRAAFGRRQDDGDAGAARRARAARRRCARGESRARLHRSGVPCRGDGRASVNLDSWAMPRRSARRAWPRRPRQAPMFSSSKA